MQTKHNCKTERHEGHVNGVHDGEVHVGMGLVEEIFKCFRGAIESVFLSFWV